MSYQNPQNGANYGGGYGGGYSIGPNGNANGLLDQRPARFARAGQRASYGQQEMPPLMGRIPPQNMEAEMAVLGAMLLGDRGAIESAMDIVSREDFYRDAHAHLFDAMVNLAQKSEPVDLVTLRNELTRVGILEQIGGVAYIVQLGDIEFTTANIEYYAKIVADKAALRRLIETTSLIAGMAYGEVDDAGALISEAEIRILELSSARRGNRGAVEEFKPLIDKTLTLIEDQYHRKGQLTGLSTGFYLLDFQTSGLQNGDLIIIAARPSMGKSSLASQMATNIAKTGASVLFFSLEMNKNQIGVRILCCEGRVDGNKVRNGTLSDSDWSKISETAERLWDCAVGVDDASGVSLEYIRSVCRKRAATTGLDAVFIDYLQIMEASHSKRSGENRNAEVTEMIQGLKNMARTLDIPVVVLSQLSRKVEQREDKRPMLGDLRDSGSLEAEADVVFFPFRPAYYDRKKNQQNAAGFDEDDDGAPDESHDFTEPEEAEIIIAKQRMGPTATVKVLFTPAYTRFDNRFSVPGVGDSTQAWKNAPARAGQGGF